MLYKISNTKLRVRFGFNSPFMLFLLECKKNDFTSTLKCQVYVELPRPIQMPEHSEHYSKRPVLLTETLS